MTQFKRFLAVAILVVGAAAVHSQTPPVTSAESSAAPAATGSPATAGSAPAAAAESNAPAAPTEPQLIAVDKISAGDTAWMLTSTALVLMMTIPGLALFY